VKEVNICFHAPVNQNVKLKPVNIFDQHKGKRHFPLSNGEWRYFGLSSYIAFCVWKKNTKENAERNTDWRLCSHNNKQLTAALLYLMAARSVLWILA